jgi:hypothetical protein
MPRLVGEILSKKIPKFLGHNDNGIILKIFYYNCFIALRIKFLNYINIIKKLGIKE